MNKGNTMDNKSILMDKLLYKRNGCVMKKYRRTTIHIAFCVLIKVLTNLKHFQSMPHSHAILCWIYIVLLSSSDV